MLKLCNFWSRKSPWPRACPLSILWYKLVSRLAVKDKAIPQISFNRYFRPFISKEIFLECRKSFLEAQNGSVSLSAWFSVLSAYSMEAKSCHLTLPFHVGYDLYCDCWLRDVRLGLQGASCLFRPEADSKGDKDCPKFRPLPLNNHQHVLGNLLFLSCRFGNLISTASWRTRN